MARVGSLVIDLIAETASFNTNIKRASQNLNSETAQMVRSLQKVEAGITGLKRRSDAFLGSQIFGELKRITVTALEMAGSLNNAAQQIGVSAQDLQTYRYAASQVGLSNAEMDSSLQRLTLTLGKAQLGVKAAKGAFDMIGVAVRDADGKMRATADVLPEIADALARIPDPTRRAAVEVALFGEAGQKLDTLLAQGSGAIDELRNAAQRLGLVLDQDAIKNADQAASKLGDVKKVLEARIVGTVSENAGAIVRLAESLLRVTTAGINLVNNYPRISAALAGVVAGGAVGGVPGAAIGGAAGAAMAENMSSQSQLNAAHGKWLFTAQNRIMSNKSLSWEAKQKSLAIVRQNADERFGYERTNYWGLFGVGKATRNPFARTAPDAVLPPVPKSPITGLPLDLFGGDDGKPGGKGKGKTGGGGNRALDQAAKDAAATQRELAQSFDDLLRRYDPAAAAMADYREHLEQIDKLVSAGKLNASMAQRWRDAGEREMLGLPDLEPGSKDNRVDKMIDEMVAAGKRMDQFAADAAIVRKRPRSVGRMPAMAFSLRSTGWPMGSRVAVSSISLAASSISASR